MPEKDPRFRKACGDAYDSLFTGELFEETQSIRALQVGDPVHAKARDGGHDRFARFLFSDGRREEGYDLAHGERSAR